MANERTFLAWVRTSIALVGLGFVVAKFGILLREVAGAHVHYLTAKIGGAVGVSLVIGGAGMVLLSTQRFDRTRRDIDEGIVRFDPGLVFFLSALVVVLSTMLAIYLVVTA